LGVVFLDKPSGPTSRRAAEVAARLLGAEKVGHGGTLDPKVTGLLPVLLGSSTRIAALLLGSDKAYVGAMQLHGDVARAEVEAAVARCQGFIEQVPPRRSSVKRQRRRRLVHSFALTGFCGRRAEFSLRCQGGTYVRKLVHDLGQQLGCGAHMVRLRRTQLGAFTLDDCVGLDELSEAADRLAKGNEGPARRCVQPVEQVVTRLLPQVVVDDGAVASICGGFPAAVPGICQLDDLEAGATVAIMTLKGELVAIGRALLDSGSILSGSSGLAVSVNRVFMRPDVYPKWRSRRE
jgi:H/ACA ribonucleoprotein complex subunit 4